MDKRNLMKPTGYRKGSGQPQVTINNRSTFLGSQTGRLRKNKKMSENKNSS
jgi:hypothetical protein